MPFKSMLFILKCNRLLLNRRQFHLQRQANNHYDTLKLKPQCTQKEIKESFIRLSKEHHPDVDKRKDSHEKFLKINEAYNTLSKPESRRLYDLGLSGPISDYAEYTVRTTARQTVYREDVGRDPWKDPSFYHNRDKSQDKYYEGKPYYGIKGINRVSNMTIAFICILISAVGGFIQAIAIIYSVTFKREKLQEKSREAESIVNESRRKANENGNQLQIEILKKRIEEERRRRQLLNKEL